MGKSFQFNNRKETEKTEDIINTLVTATAPLTSTYDDVNNTLTLAVETGGGDGDLLKVGGVDITANQFIKMEADGDVVGVSSGVASGNLLKVKDGVSLTNGQFVKIDSGEIISAVPPDTQPLDATGVQTAMNTLIEKDATTDNTLIKYDGTTKMTLGEIGGDSIASFTTTELAGDTLVCDTTLRSNQSTTATSGDFLLKRNTTTKLTFGNDKTTLINNTHHRGSMCFHNTENMNSKGFQCPLVVLDSSNPNLSASNFASLKNTEGLTTGFSHNLQNATSIHTNRAIFTRTNFISSGGTLDASDDRIKTEEIPIENATDVLMKVVPKNYWKHPSYRVDEDDESPIPEKDLSGDVIHKFYESGVIAQDILDITELKHLINLSLDTLTEEDTLVVSYQQFIPFLIKSIQELNARIITLENKI